MSEEGKRGRSPSPAKEGSPKKAAKGKGGKKAASSSGKKEKKPVKGRSMVSMRAHWYV